MNYQIITLDEFTGDKATIYSILPEGENLTLYDKFVEEYCTDYYDDILSIADLLIDMGCKYGIRENLIKTKEGKPGDGVVAIFDNPDKNLRLYGIRYGASILLLGSGGVKGQEVMAWQDDAKLKKEAEIVIQISKEVSKRVQDREINISLDHMRLTGNLNFLNNDDK